MPCRAILLRGRGVRGSIRNIFQGRNQISQWQHHRHITTSNVFCARKPIRTEKLARFAGGTSPFTHEAYINKPDDNARIPCYRVIDTKAQVLNETELAEISTDQLHLWYREMVTIRQYDRIMHDLQKQGRIVFYAGNNGEEATHIGTASALTVNDIVYSQYRECGVLLHRGWPMENFINQCLSNDVGHGRGRQVPVHYGSKQLNFHTVSSPLGPQIPQASGAGFALKGTGNCVICFFGEGAASEGDAHAAFNFAATLDCPVIFFCRNNGYAISTPAHEQYRGDGIASRAAGYGMAVTRVDGNDIVAVHLATKRAKELAVRESRPVMIEAMTYRIGDHSTSDDASVYRTDEEVLKYQAQMPIERLQLLMTNMGEWDKERDDALVHEIRQDIIKKLLECEKFPAPSIESMFDDVLEPTPPHLHSQREEMLQHLKKYANEYDLRKYAKHGPQTPIPYE
eukprot:m.175324 g.175324  ORF g.175324 m.175324 type:complete len:455 (-) comp31810_c0_seq1:112-1476(-)